jgi:primary-amine oxidase
MRYVLFTSLFRLLVLLSTLTLCSSLAWAATAKHPLDSLDKDEIAQAVMIMHASPDFPWRALFSTIQLNEPPKHEVLSFRAGSAFRCEAFAVLFDWESNRRYEAAVDLLARKVVSWTEVADVQPLVFMGEYETL